jgi:hypothetical protein
MARPCDCSPAAATTGPIAIPQFAAAAAELRATLDGRGGGRRRADGVAVFDALHRRHKAAGAMLYAFHLLVFNGKDLGLLPLGDRKAKLARAPAGIVFNEHADEDGAVVFRRACKLGFKGIVSKRLNAPYRPRPSRRQPMALKRVQRAAPGRASGRAASASSLRITSSSAKRSRVISCLASGGLSLRGSPACAIRARA